MNTTGPQLGDTAEQAMTINGIGKSLIPVTVTDVTRNDADPDFPYLVTLAYDITIDGTIHTGQLTTRLNALCQDHNIATVSYRRAQHHYYLVPTDPMDDLGCDSCQ